VRVAAAAEVRHAPHCGLCRRRKAALTPYVIDGRHDSLDTLPETWIEVIHRIVSDPGRLTRGWYQRMLAAGVSDADDVEIVSGIVHVTALDTFARGLGMPLQALPQPASGAPSRYCPKEARQHGHWVPTIALHEHGPDEANYFIGPPANIRVALTLVPNEARSFFDLCASQYLPGPAMRDFAAEYRAISNAQIELLAGRISAIYQCIH